MTPEIADFLDRLLTAGGRTPWADIDAAAAARQSLDDIRTGRVVMARPAPPPPSTDAPAASESGEQA